MNYLCVFSIICLKYFRYKRIKQEFKRNILKVILRMDLRVNPVQFPQISKKYIYLKGFTALKIKPGIKM